MDDRYQENLNFSCSACQKKVYISDRSIKEIAFNYLTSKTTDDQKSTEIVENPNTYPLYSLSEALQIQLKTLQDLARKFHLGLVPQE